MTETPLGGRLGNEHCVTRVAAEKPRPPSLPSPVSVEQPRAVKEAHAREFGFDLQLRYLLELSPEFGRESQPTDVTRA